MTTSTSNMLQCSYQYTRNAVWYNNRLHGSPLQLQLLHRIPVQSPQKFCHQARSQVTLLSVTVNRTLMHYYSGSLFPFLCMKLPSRSCYTKNPIPLHEYPLMKFTRDRDHFERTAVDVRNWLSKRNTLASIGEMGWVVSRWDIITMMCRANNVASRWFSKGKCHAVQALKWYC